MPIPIWKVRDSPTFLISVMTSGDADAGTWIMLGAAPSRKRYVKPLRYICLVPGTFYTFLNVIITTTL